MPVFLTMIMTEFKNNIEQGILDQFKPFINKEAAKFSKASSVCDINDLRQAGYIGLLFAHEHFDKSKGVKWSTYAIKCIRNAIITESIKFLKTLTLPKGAAFHFHKINKLLKDGNSVADISDKLSLSIVYVKDICRLIQINERDVIHNFGDIESNIDNNFIDEINDAFDNLTNQEKLILKLKTTHTLNEVGEKLGISREWARIKYRNILEKLVVFISNRGDNEQKD